MVLIVIMMRIVSLDIRVKFVFEYLGGDGFMRGGGVWVVCRVLFFIDKDFYLNDVN